MRNVSIPYFVCVLLLCCSTGKIFAQDPDPSNFKIAKPDQSIPSSSFLPGELTTDPNGYVDLFSGKPKAHISLYTLVAGKLQLPVSIAYSTGGCLVEDHAGLVGTGWNLSAGGGISRQMNGLPDEMPNNSVKIGFRAAAGIFGMPDTTTNSATLWNWLNQLSPCHKEKIANGRYDLLPDIYSTSLINDAANIFFDRNRVPLISPYKNWKISGDENTGFSVIDESGTIYFFNALEKTNLQTNSSSSWDDNLFDYTSGWKLTKIISPDLTDSILISYQVNSVFYPSNIPGETVLNLSKETYPPGGAPPQNVINQKTYTERTVGEQMITKIESRYEIINFFYNADRRDADGVVGGNKNKLDSLQVLAKTPAGVKLIKSFHFSYVYWGEGSSTNAEKLRLMLKKLTIAGRDTTKYSYNFQYYNDTQDPPSKKSLSQDHWGFFNGANNTTLLPPSIGLDGQRLTGANKEPDFNTTIRGSLQRITFPTGGSVTYTYEQNDMDGSEAGVETTLRNLTQSIGTPDIIQRGEASKKVDLPFNQLVEFTYNITASNPSDANAGVSVVSDATQQEIFGTQSGVPPRSYSTFLTKGTYTITAYKGYGTDYASISMNYVKIDTLPNPRIYMTGGIRVSKLTLNDGMGNDNVQIIKYRLNDSTSSGRLFFMPKYEGTQYFPIIVGGLIGKVGDYKYRMRSASSVTSSSPLLENHVCYAQVVLMNAADSSGGRTEMAFSLDNMIDYPVNAFPYTIPSSLKDLRGALLSEKIFGANNKLLQKKVNTYSLNNSNYPLYKVLSGVKMGFLKTGSLRTANGCPDLNANNQWDIPAMVTEFRQYCPFVQSTQTTRYAYQNQTIDSVVEESIYDYSRQTLQLTKETTSQSDKINTVKVMKYPVDFSSEGVYVSMTNRNMINTPVEVITLRNDNETSRQKSNFSADWFPDQHLIATSSTYTGFNGNTPEEKYRIYKYSESGQIQEHSASNNVHEVVLWGYDNRYPIAKVSGSDYNTIMSLVNPSVLQSPADDQQLRVELQKIRSALSGTPALVVTYTYSPSVGITSETDATGRTTFYEYDGLNRLKCIKDQQGKILKTLDYQYQQSISK